jgi:hypothetical protein
MRDREAAARRRYDQFRASLDLTPRDPDVDVCTTSSRAELSGLVG